MEKVVSVDHQTVTSRLAGVPLQTSLVTTADVLIDVAKKWRSVDVDGANRHDMKLVEPTLQKPWWQIDQCPNPGNLSICVWIKGMTFLRCENWWLDMDTQRGSGHPSDFRSYVTRPPRFGTG